eukprot:jgi/Galph1/4219/GphlegSOOS_G2837.1
MDLPLFYCDRSGLASPLVNRQQAVLQVLEAFSDSYDNSDPTSGLAARPVVCFAGHMYGAGKTTFGVRFNEFLVINKEYISQARSEQRFPGCATPEESLDALYNKTLFVYLSLKEFPQKGTDFAYNLAQRICKAALSEFPSSDELLSEVLPLVPQGPSEWLRKLLQVTDKKYLFLCVDEIGYLGVKDRFRLSDLRSPSSNKDSSNVYPTCFRILSDLFPVVYVFCIIAGRSDAIVLRKQDAMPSRIMLKVLQLDPFPCQSVQYIMEHSIYGKQNIQKILFPSNRQQLDALSRIIWEYTGGVPIYVHHVLTELAKMCVSNVKWRDLSVKDLKEKVETIHMIDSLFVHVDRMEPRCFKIPISTNETYFGGIELGSHSEYVLDIASHFGFYYTSDEASSTFTLVYPKIVLKYLETHYKQIPVFRFSSHLFSMITQSDGPVSRGWKFEILFSLVLYLKLCFCSKLGEMGIFQKTFVEDYLLVKVDGVQSRKPIPLFQYVASFSSRVAREVSAAGLTYHPNAWNLFYEPFLSKEDGIFILSSQHSRGPDLIIRLSKNVTEETTTSSQMADSTQLVTFSSQEEPIVYLIGISLKCYHLTGPGVGRSFIKDETEKFLIPVAQQLELKAKNIVVIQLIISTKYSIEVTRKFTDHQNWILNSGVYYENDNGELVCQSLSSAAISGFANEWLTIPSRCQLVVCSTTSLQSFLGPEAYSQLEQVFRNENATQTDSKLIPPSSALTSCLQGMLTDEPKSRRGAIEKKARKKRKIRPRSHANAIQVEDTRRRQSADALSSMDSSFDWKTFLRERCGFSEASVIERYARRLRVFTPSSFPYVNDQWLFSFHIEPQNVPIILKAIIEYMNEREIPDS